MANLSGILSKYSGAESNDQNIEKGKVYYVTPGTMNAYFCCRATVCMPAAGQAIIEVWGASGSGAMMCCCAIGLPGNPGAYLKRTVNVDSSTRFCIRDDQIGFSCGNSSSLCFRGCSQPAQVTACSPNGTFTGPTGNSSCFCLCSQGGMGGMHLCQESCSVLCRYRSCNYCATQIGSNGCGIICNYGSSFNFLPTAYGGDINCGGGFSCLFAGHCNNCCTNCFIGYLQVAAGVYGPEQQSLKYGYMCGHNFVPMRTSGFPSYLQSIAGHAKSPTQAQPMYGCWDSNMYCGCYEYNGCTPVASHGIPGYGGKTCSSVRDHATRGAHGAVRIQFIRS